MVEIIQPDGCAEDVRMSPGLDLRSRPAVKTVSYLSFQSRPASDTDYSMKNCLSSAGIPVKLIEHFRGQVQGPALAYLRPDSPSHTVRAPPSKPLLSQSRRRS